MANKYATLKDLFTAIANAIRSKTGSTSAIVADDFPDAIYEITVNGESSTDFSVVTAGAGDVRSTKYFLNSSGVKTQGTLITRNSNSVTVSTNKVTIPTGIYDSQVTKTITTATQATPSITFDAASGKIKATSTQSAGYVSAGTKTSTIDPVSLDSSLKSANIVKGQSIFGIPGSAEVGGTSGGDTTETEFVYKQVEDVPVFADFSGSTEITINIDEDIDAIGAIKLFYSSSGYYGSEVIGASLVAFSDMSGSNQYYLRGTLTLMDGTYLDIDPYGQDSYQVYINVDNINKVITLDIGDTNCYFGSEEYLACYIYGVKQEVENGISMSNIVSRSIKNLDNVSSETIGDYAFAGCEQIEEIDCPSVLEIGKYAFCDCTGISTIDFTNATTIGERAFQNCTNASVINLPSVQTIGTYAFSGCKSIDELNINSATTIGQRAFQNCTNLSVIDCGPNITKIDMYAFYGCSFLTGLYLRNTTSVCEIDSTAFAACKLQTEGQIYVPSTLLKDYKNAYPTWGENNWFAVIPD